MTFRLSSSVSEHKQAGRACHLHLRQELPQVQLFYDAGNDWLYANWRGPQTAATVLEGSEMILATVAANGHTKLLNDNTHLTVMDVTTEEWRSIQVLARLFNAGLQYLAWVYSPDPRGRMLTDHSVARSAWPLILTFEEYNMAVEWLRQF